MMTKRIYQRVLTAAAVVVLGLGMVSCTDKFDNSTQPSDNQQEQQAEQARESKAQKYWTVVSHLVDVDDYTEDYADKTFEPTYGVSQGNDGTRYVYTNDAATAAERFADLVDRDDIDENTQSYTYDDPDVGTLVYTKGSGRTLATVDVDIKQIPTLKKIVYVPGAYANGSFQGRAYYRFGDVLSREVEGKKEYWICVRPSFGPEGKGDSHWVCVNMLPEKNIKDISTSNNKTFYLPTRLGKNEEHMQNLAELLYAIYFPDEWQENVSDIANTSLRMFHDFNKANYTYHNQYYWQHVQNLWRDKHILQEALNFDGTEQEFKNMLKYDGLRLLHSGYSWLTTFSWNCTLYEAIFKNGDANKEKNMHKDAYNNVVRDMQNLDKLDCHKTGKGYNGTDYYANYKNFFLGNNEIEEGNKYRWAIRHATGKELAANGRYSVKTKIEGVEDVYRYYRDVLDTNNLDLNPEVTEEMTVVPNAVDGRGTYMIGDVVKDEDDNRWFCISGTSVSNSNPGATDSLATFISFDFNDVNTSDNTIAGLPTEEEIPEVAYKMIHFMFCLRNRGDAIKYAAGSQGRLGTIGQHILDYANVDLGKISMTLDSIFRFTAHNKVYNSTSTPLIFNIAYDDGSKDRQAVLRAIFDDTLGGSERTHCETAAGKKYQDFYYRFYKHYETFDLQNMRPATDDERELGVNDWGRTWVMTQDKITLQDVANQDMVNRYAQTDKWATLPFAESALDDYHGPRRQARTEAEKSARPSDYIGHYGKNDTPKTNLFNEPVCFFRVMKVKDFNNRKLNLVSEDGRHLSVVHLLNNYICYDQALQSSWAIYYSSSCSSFVYLDNLLYKIPPVKGMEYMAVED